MARDTVPKMAKPVTVSLQDLKSVSVPFATLEEAFGPSSLGIIIVKDLPELYASLRLRVLSSASYLANLPETELKKLTNERAKYLVGWSHGKETLRTGVLDTRKGSYYINCAFYHDPALQGADGEAHPGFEDYTAPNVWPSEKSLPNFRENVEALITLIMDTAVLVARACDRYAVEKVDGYRSGYLEGVVKTSLTTKARLLHYFPSDSNAPPKAQLSCLNGTDGVNGGNETKRVGGDAAESDDWCATHVDHGCLTGLTSAMFVDESSGISAEPSMRTNSLHELPKSPSPSSGLYVRSRENETCKVNIPRDCLAFQTGAALELITKGKFRAVPHFVRAGAVDEPNRKIARNTLAVFTQPNLEELVDLEKGITFGEFARSVVKQNTVG